MRLPAARLTPAGLGPTAALTFPAAVPPLAELPELAGHDASAPLELISEFHERMERRGRCKLDVVLLTEEVESAEMVGLYPVNALRNKALMLSQTEVGGVLCGGRQACRSKRLGGWAAASKQPA